jgi:hypothetical protein
MPFIMLGIGVDDIFVMVRSMEEVSEVFPGASIEERFRKALNLGGMSITVTSATNFAAFMFGSLTSIPAVTWCEISLHSYIDIVISFMQIPLKVRRMGVLDA